MTESQTPEMIDVSVQAEYAPIGVRLWPTDRPDQAIHFTLRSVAVVRNKVRSWVVWTYEDNTIRTLDLGEMVAARVISEVAALIQPPQMALGLTIDEQAAIRDALRLVLYKTAPAATAPADMLAVLKRLVDQI